MDDANTDPKHLFEALERDYSKWSLDSSKRVGASRPPADTPLEQLLEISGAMHRIHDRDELLTYVSERLRDFFDAQNSFVILFDEQGAPLILNSNLEGGADGPLLSSTVLERARNSHEPIVVSDTASDPDLCDSTSIEFLRIASVMCAPLIVEEKVIGILQFDHRGEGHLFPSSDTRLLQLFANQIATAVYNLQLIERRDEALEETRRTQEKLIQSERLAAVGRLAAGVAHDFNNTLFIALGQCDATLARGGLSTDAVSSIERIQSCAIDAAKTVKRLQSLGPGSTGLGSRERVSLAEIAAEIPELTRGKWSDEAAERGVTISFEVKTEPCPDVLADPAELREILTNLVFNSVEAMKTDGVIRISTGVSGSCVFAAVEDEGSGMTEEQRAHAFEPFFSSKAGRGHGFGLSTCWSLAEGMGATWEVESEVGRGSRFALVVPSADAVPPQVRLENAPPARVSGAPDHSASLDILVVEDDSDVRQTLERMLEARGHRVEALSSAMDALERISAHDFSLVITDMSMPGMTGAELAAQLQLDRPALPVVLISGYGATGQVEVPPNVQAMLPKPIGLSDLSDALSRVRFPSPQS